MLGVCCGAWGVVCVEQDVLGVGCAMGGVLVMDKGGIEDAAVEWCGVLGAMAKCDAMVVV